MAIIKAPEDTQARKAWLTALRELQRRKQPICSLSDFVKYMWPVIEPGTDLVWNWHMDAVCAHLEAVAFGGIKNLIINVPPGTSKPCSVDGHVLERTRGRIRLGDVGVGDEVLTHKGRFRRVLAVHQQGILSRLEIQTHMGRAVRVADDHSVLTTRGWIQAKDLTEADSTAVVHPREDCGTRTIPLEEARLLGYLIGDGCVKYGGARFTNQDPESVADFEACAVALGFGLSKAKKAGGTADTYDVKLRSKAPGTRTSIVSDFLTKHDLAGRCSYDKRVPPAVLAGRADIVADFIAAYWACDGTIHDRRDLPRSGRPGQLSQVIRLEAVTVSAELAHDLQHLFSRLGMRMRVRRKTTQLKTRAQGDTYSAWHVVAEDQDTVAKFMQYIAPRMRHEKRTRAQGTVRRGFDAVLNPDPVARVVRIDPGECRCLTVEEDSSFVFDDIAVHNSTIATVMWPTWMWTFNPEWRLVAASYADTLSLRDGAKARVLLESQRYKDAFAPAWKLQGDVNAKGYYQNSKMGFRVSVSVGGAGTGLRGNTILVDDPLNASESHSKPARDAVKWWWDQGFANRLNDMRTGSRVVIMQRLHEEDLTGHLLAQSDPKWDHLCLPSEFDPERRSVTNAQWYIPPGLPGQGTLAQFADPRQKKGELLFPARFPVEVLAQERVRLGSSGYSGQHDQDPTAEGGNKFKLEWWRFWKPDGVAAAGAARPRGCNSAPAVPLPERFDDMLISVDCTFKAVSRSKDATAQSDIDFVCASVIGRKGANKFLLDQRHGRWGLKATLNVIRELRNDYPRARRILVEDKANGSAVIETLEEELDGVIAVQPEGGKEARAAACEPQIESGNFYLPEGAPWLPAFLAEFAAFPKGKHDDRVDSVTQALVWWINGAKSLARARMMGSW